jgi:peptidoglycan hydrolase-like protein with peptidoglycan-binding domain
MSIDSFGMTMASLPAPTAPSAASLDPAPAKQQAASDDSSTTSASSTDPLMAALQQTLSQLGYNMPAGSLTTSTASGTGSPDGSSTGAVNTSSSDATSTGAQFLAALYQALALQQSISADNGGTSSGNSSSNAIASFNDSATSGGVSAYRDLGSRIAELSNAANAVDNDADEDAGAWDVEVDDMEVSGPDEAEDGEDPLDTAMSNLNNALQAHGAALDQDPAATVTLSDVLEGLSDSAGSLNWQPVGVLLDVSA